MSTKVFTSSCVYFPGGGPSPGTIQVDLSTGKIIKVQRVKSRKGDPDYPLDAEWVDVGDLAIIPGLVEYVRLIGGRNEYSHSNLSSVHTFI